MSSASDLLIGALEDNGGSLKISRLRSIGRRLGIKVKKTKKIVIQRGQAEEKRRVLSLIDQT